MRKSTNKLTKQVLNFASSKEYPLTKHRIMKTMTFLFDELGHRLSDQFNNFDYLTGSDYKITKGENYNFMPYVVLDFPKMIGHKFPIVCRTIFWWGHYFTANLIIDTELIDVTIFYKNKSTLKKTYVLIGENLWDNNLQSGNYILINKLSIADLTILIENRNYLRLSHKIKLSQINDIEIIAPSIYNNWLKIINKK